MAECGVGRGAGDLVSRGRGCPIALCALFCVPVIVADGVCDATLVTPVWRLQRHWGSGNVSGPCHRLDPKPYIYIYIFFFLLPERGFKCRPPPPRSPGSPERSKGSRRRELLQRFAFRPDEVKEYLASRIGVRVSSSVHLSANEDFFFTAFSRASGPCGEKGRWGFRKSRVDCFDFTSWQQLGLGSLGSLRHLPDGCERDAFGRDLRPLQPRQGGRSVRPSLRLLRLCHYQEELAVDADPDGTEPTKAEDRSRA